MLSYPTWNIRKIFWLLLTALFIAASAVAQPRACSTKTDQLPDAAELIGFRVGMTFEQAKAHVPQVQAARTDQFGVAKISINPHFDPAFNKIIFADERTISLDFLDGKLVSLWIGYDTTFKWQTLETFVPGISKALNLPAAWPEKRGGRQLTCEGFTVFASIIAGSPSLRITDDAAQEMIATRREEAAEAAAAMVIADQRTKLYYPSDCSVLAVAEIDRIRFKDKDEAEKAGFKLAKVCQ